MPTKLNAEASSLLEALAAAQKGQGIPITSIPPPQFSLLNDIRGREEGQNPRPSISLADIPIPGISQKAREDLEAVANSFGNDLDLFGKVTSDVLLGPFIGTAAQREARAAEEQEAQLKAQDEAAIAEQEARKRILSIGGGPTGSQAEAQSAMKALLESGVGRGGSGGAGGTPFIPLPEDVKPERLEVPKDKKDALIAQFEKSKPGPAILPGPGRDIYSGLEGMITTLPIATQLSRDGDQFGAAAALVLGAGAGFNQLSQEREQIQREHAKEGRLYEAQRAQLDAELMSQDLAVDQYNLDKEFKANNENINRRIKVEGLNANLAMQQRQLAQSHAQATARNKIAILSALSKNQPDSISAFGLNVDYQQFKASGATPTGRAANAILAASDGGHGPISQKAGMIALDMTKILDAVASSPTDLEAAYDRYKKSSPFISYSFSDFSAIASGSNLSQQDFNRYLLSGTDKKFGQSEEAQNKRYRTYHSMLSTAIGLPSVTVFDEVLFGGR